MFESLDKMATVEGILKYGTRVGNKLSASDSRLYSRDMTPGVGMIYNVIVTDAQYENFERQNLNQVTEDCQNALAACTRNPQQCSETEKTKLQAAVTAAQAAADTVTSQSAYVPLASYHCSFDVGVTCSTAYVVQRALITRWQGTWVDPYPEPMRFDSLEPCALQEQQIAHAPCALQGHVHHMRSRSNVMLCWYIGIRMKLPATTMVFANGSSPTS